MIFIPGTVATNSFNAVAFASPASVDAHSTFGPGKKVGFFALSNFFAIF